MLRLAILTTGRQDWGGLSVIAHRLKNSSRFEVVVIAGGMHAMDGNPGRIPNELDGLRVDAAIPVLPAEDSAWGVADAAGRTTIATADALRSTKAHALVVLGDRTETLAAAVAATCLRIPLIHFHGGEESVGAIDNACRHAITKLSHVHFVAHESFKRRLERMGEPSDRIFVSGAPALDAAVHQKDHLSRDSIAQKLRLDSSKEWLVCTHHPATLAAEADSESDALVAELDALLTNEPRVQLVITRPNVDEGSSRIVGQLTELSQRHSENVRLVSALGHSVYFSLLPECTAMIGNSSSGIIEAPLFRLPTVNVGVRQQGRLRGVNVIDVDGDRAKIREAILFARSPEMKKRLDGTTSPYGDGNAAERVAQALESLGEDLRDTTKPFAD